MKDRAPSPLAAIPIAACDGCGVIMRASLLETVGPCRNRCEFCAKAIYGNVAEAQPAQEQE